MVKSEKSLEIEQEDIKLPVSQKGQQNQNGNLLEVQNKTHHQNSTVTDTENQNKDFTDHGTFNIKEDSKYQIFVRCLLISFGAIYTGYNLGSYSFVQPTMNYVLGNESEDSKSLTDGICNALVTIGIGIGGISTNYILNNVIKSRRKFIYLADGVQFISCVLQVIASAYTILPGRLLGGLSAGANFLVCPIYIKEMVPMKWLGTCMSIYSSCVNVGVVLSYLVAFTLEWDPTQNVPYIWRLNLGFPAIFCILRILAVRFLYKLDTPHYYFDIQDNENAKYSLLQTHEDKDIDKVIEFQKSQIRETEATKVAFKTLFTVKYRKRLLQALFVSGTEALTGLMIYTAYSWKIYQTVVGQKESVAYSVLQQSVQILGTIFMGGKLVQKYGRKQIMLTTLVMCTVVQISQTVVSYYVEQGHTGPLVTTLTIVLLQLYYACLGLGISCVSFLIVLDVVPQAGVSMANSCMALFNSVYSFGFPILIQHIPMWKALLVISIMDVITMIIFKLWVKETKGLNEQQLDVLFNKKKQ